MTEPEPPSGPAGPARLAGPLPALRPLALARGTVDRSTERRTDPAWFEARWADPGTRVLVIDDGQALVRFSDADAELVLLPAAQAPEGPRYLLGVDDDGRAYFSVTAPPAASMEPAAPGRTDEPARAAPAGLRQVGRCSGTGTPACSPTPWPWPTGTPPTRTARAAAR